MLIGIDVGTTTVKAALFDLKGVAVKTYAARYPTLRPQAGHVEQTASDWTERVETALAELGKGQAVAAIGLCSQVNTHVFVDAEGHALMPALTWQDGRCAAEAADLDALVAIEDKLKWWGAPLPIDASHVLSRMAHVAKHHPDIWQKTRWVMAPKDFCIQHLTGAVVADPMTNFGIVDQALQPISSLIDLVAGAAGRLPPLAGFTHVAGHVRAGLACAGVPVVTGAMDAWSGLFGAGVSREGDGLYLSGTSEILGIVSERKVPTPGVIAFPHCEGITLHAGPTQSGGASVEWVCRVLGKSPDEISALASRADVPSVPLFLPHLEGERAPLWDVHSRGAFAGLSSSSGAAEIARAVLEGVGYSARLVFESLERSAGLRPDAIFHSGGGVASDVWCQIRADILQRPVHRTVTRDAGVLGAAIMAGVGVGLLPSLSSAAKSFVRLDRVFEPVRSAAARHYERFETYKQLYEQLKPLTSGQ